jgi:uncharacterized protein
VRELAVLEPLYGKSCSCPVCKNNFTSQKVRSRFVKIKGYDTDFLPFYDSDESNPIFYYIQVCPQCGFSFSEEFSPYFPPGSKEQIDEKITSQWKPRDFGRKRSRNEAIQTYKLAVYSALLKKEKHVSIAGLYMRLAWLYRNAGDKSQDQRFMKLAAYEYVESYSNGDYQGTQISETRLLYLIAELSRKTGSDGQAIKFFSKVIEQQNRSLEPGIIDMARDRWHEMRESRRQTC